MFFFFNNTATTEIYTLSLHDALPISECDLIIVAFGANPDCALLIRILQRVFEEIVENALKYSEDRKSTRLNSSHANISYAVFCLKKKKKIRQTRQQKDRVLSTTR